MVKYLLKNISSEYMIKKIDLKHMELQGCKACDYCAETGDCLIRDDMQQIYEEIDSSDIFIVSSPVYFNSVTSLLKKLIDRTQVYWSRKYKLDDNYKRGLDRKGYFLSTAGSRYDNNNFISVIPVIDYFFKAINAKYIGNYLISNTDRQNFLERDDILKDLKYIARNIDGLYNFTIHK